MQNQERWATGFHKLLSADAKIKKSPGCDNNILVRQNMKSVRAISNNLPKKSPQYPRTAFFGYWGQKNSCISLPISGPRPRFFWVTTQNLLLNWHIWRSCAYDTKYPFAQERTNCHEREKSLVPSEHPRPEWCVHRWLETLGAVGCFGEACEGSTVGGFPSYLTSGLTCTLSVP